MAYNRTGLSGYLAFGSTGESALLDRAEFEKVLATVREPAAPGRILIAGTGVDSTAETISRTEVAAKLGYHFALVCTPYFFKADDERGSSRGTLPPRCVDVPREFRSCSIFGAAIYRNRYRSGPGGASC